MELILELQRHKYPLLFLRRTIEEATLLIQDLRENYSIFCSIVTFIIVPTGTIILRITPTARYTVEDVEYTLKYPPEMINKLKAGEYKRAFTEVKVNI